jgi:addiction module HigA family antidote
MAKKLKPVHPGEVLREEFMKPHALSMNKLATDLRVPVTRIAEIYHERRGITADTALRLARYLNTSAAFWVNLQWRYELEIAEDREATRIARDVRPLEPAASR